MTATDLSDTAERIAAITDPTERTRAAHALLRERQEVYDRVLGRRDQAVAYLEGQGRSWAEIGELLLIPHNRGIFKALLRVNGERPGKRLPWTRRANVPPITDAEAILLGQETARAEAERGEAERLRKEAARAMLTESGLRPADVARTIGTSTANVARMSVKK